VITFAGLVGLAAVSWLLSSFGAPPAVALAIAAVKAVWIALVFMELAGGHPLPRTIAVIAVLFVGLLCLGTWSDTVLRQ
jgi:caa(3)-type oxidase subunit IV